MSTPAQIAANRENARKSTGPRTLEGKQRSCRNAHKHGLYSDRIVQEHENEEDYHRFRAALIAEHQPVNTTETFLVDELAQNGWKIRRLRDLEAWAIQRDAIEVHIENGYLPALTRALSAAERAFHRALAALTKMQKDRGFIPKNLSDVPADFPETHYPPPKSAAAVAEPRSATGLVPPSIGFVSQNITQSQPAPAPTRSISPNHMPHPA